jgi:hypothetical protein
VTPNHPYLRPSDVIGKGVLELVKMDPGGDWTAVLKLKPGDELVSAFGVPLVVDSIDVDDAPTRVYSLEVEGLHSFAVGELAAWVHNAKKRKPPSTKAGPSGSTNYPTRKKAQEAAQCACGAGGWVYEDANPSDGRWPHFHAVTKDGKKKRWHFCYPPRNRPPSTRNSR